MAKKKAASDFNMSEAIREILTENPKLGSQEVIDVITAKYPKEQINKNSFSVAFYTGRKKLGIGSPRGKKAGMRVGIRKVTSTPTIDMMALQSAAKFLRELGSADAAIEAIKQVQTMQLR